ncbi:MAG TPA: hypothetical protein VKA83_09585 [Methylomirabilota bacterium]|nr:hypothetical protein [Methylomirabilota bacterium]
MNDDEEVKRKRAGLTKILRKHIGNMSHAGASQLIDAYCQTPVVRILPGGSGGGHSRKPRNLRLNLKNLFTLAAEGTLAGATVAGQPWTAPFAALLLWNSVYSRMKRDIQEREASVIWAMWLNREKNKVPKDRVLAMVNAERVNHGRAPLSAKELNDSLALLKEMRCIKEDGKNWLLTESVSVKWDKGR